MVQNHIPYGKIATISARVFLHRCYLTCAIETLKILRLKNVFLIGYKLDQKQATGTTDKVLYLYGCAAWVCYA